MDGQGETEDRSYYTCGYVFVMAVGILVGIAATLVGQAIGRML